MRSFGRSLQDDKRYKGVILSEAKNLSTDTRQIIITTGEEKKSDEQSLQFFSRTGHDAGRGLKDMCGGDA